MSLSVGVRRVFGHRAGRVGQARRDRRRSLVPVTVTVTTWLTVPPWPSLMRDGEALGRGLAHRQVLRGAVGHGVGPAHRARLVGRGLPLTAPSVSVPPSVLVPAAATLAVCMSIRSTSLKAIVPVSLSVGVVASSVTAPIASVSPP